MTLAAIAISRPALAALSAYHYDKRLHSAIDNVRMPDDFDPYQEWLGIEPHERPVNHYRLLGIPMFTSDHELIRHAADGRMNDIRQNQMGRRGSHTQPILNALSAAKLCLLNPNTKATYDAVLEAQSRMPQPVAADRARNTVAPPTLPANEQSLVEPPMSEPPVEAPPVDEPPREIAASSPPPEPPRSEPPVPEPARSVSVSSVHSSPSRNGGGIGGIVPLVVLIAVVVFVAVTWFAFHLGRTTSTEEGVQPPVAESERRPADSPNNERTSQDPTEVGAPEPVDDPIETGQPVVVQQEGGGQIQFRPSAASLAGNATLASIDSRDALIGWQSAEDRATWKFHVTQPGQFRLRLEYASPTASNLGSYRIIVADRDIKRTVRGGGTMTSPVADEVPIALSRGGDYQLEIIPVDVSGGELFSLQSIELRTLRGG